MADDVGNMKIVKSALSRISKRLIEQRIFQRDLLTVVGNLSVTDDGMAAAFSPSNYVEQEGFNFSQEDTVSISFKGVGNDFNQELCAWTTDKLSLIINSNQIVLYSLDQALCTIGNVKIKSGDSLFIKTEITATTCYLYATVGSKVFQKVSLAENELSDITKITIGADTVSKFWDGDISLVDLVVSKNDQVYWAPSTSSAFKINKILVSDGMLPLTDKSESVLNHISNCPISEIRRTGNNIVVKGTLGAGVYQNIQEVGLYAETENGPILLALASNLGVKKGSDLEYSLIVYMDLNLNVVNTTVLPEIEVHGREYTNMKDFYTLKEVHSYVTPNLERMIKTNALGVGSYKNNEMNDTKPVGVGYDEAQVLHRFQDSIRSWEDSVNTAQGSVKLKHRFTPLVFYNFDPSKIERAGAVYVDPEGVASGFSTSGYVIVPSDSFTEGNMWEFKVVFKADNSESEQAIMCIPSNSSRIPLTLSIKDKYCELRVSKLEHITIKLAGKSATYRKEYTFEDKIYWAKEGKIDETDVERISTKGIYSVGSTVFDGRTEEVLGVIESVSAGDLLYEQLFPVASRRTYFVNIKFTGDYYSVSYSLNGKEFKEVMRVVDNQRMDIGGDPIFGIEKSGEGIKNPFYGEVFLKEWKTSMKNVDPLGVTIYEAETDLLKTETEDLNFIDYFHIPEYNYSFFKSHNLIDPAGSSFLEVFEGSISGEKDNIDFSNNKGFTLCVKALLKDPKDCKDLVIPRKKIILLKGNKEEEDYYFILEFLSSTKDQDYRTLRFSLYLPDDVIVLEKRIENKEASKYLNNAITITVTKELEGSMSIYSMYRNNEKITEVKSYISNFPNVSSHSLSNYLGNTPDYKELEERRVFDILSFEGCLKENDIYYLNNILDTNF